MTARQGKIPAIVLAGSRRTGDPLAEHLGIEHKCLAEIAGRPMINHVLEALRRCAAIGEIVVAVNDVDAFAASVAGFADVRLVSCAPSPSLSVLHAIEQLDGQWPVLLTTGDHPLLAPSMIESFISRARGDVSAGLARAEQVSQAAPDTKRTYLRFRDGRYSGCNLFFFRNERALDAIRFWRRVEQQRKKPWKLAQAFGLRPLVLYLLGRLTLDEALAEASRVLGVDARAALIEDGRAAIDVDKPSDYRLVEGLIGDGRPGR